MIITIDGPVATGKSSIAKKLAESIGFIYFDTGAMYRTLTYGILKHGIALKDAEQLDQFLNTFHLDIKISHRERHYFYEGEDVTLKIRDKDVTQFVSEVSANEKVRNTLVSIQRELANGVNVVFEGRDMGSIVFPEAALKIFLTGRDTVRAKRRFDELLKKFPNSIHDLSLEKCLREIMKRDLDDSTRQCSPLQQATDAVVIDTSDLSVEEIVFKILEYKDALKTKRPKL